MTMNELANALARVDGDAFASFLLEYEITHDDGPEAMKTMIIEALRFADAHGLRIARPPLDEAD
ncbi:hypothetical protein [Bradyrhizobium ganzhouense]|uniref:hypothetical protein n=1 Tax=Bradyrhizobium ganzhouense TaxID=1179767 RepID=UPI003CE79984